jgi:hypothetical protein
MGSSSCRLAGETGGVEYAVYKQGGKMTDLEITRLCAVAMGYDEFGWQTAGIVTGTDIPILLPTGRIRYDPLHDDAQAMALLKYNQLMVESNAVDFWCVKGWFGKEIAWKLFEGDNLNRAICECIANMQDAK